MSHICAKDEYRSLAGATNRPENIVICYVSFVPLTRLFVFEFESSRRFQLSFTDFSLVYRSAFAQIFPRSQPTREFTYTSSKNSFIHIDLFIIYLNEVGR
jgi:hypothetical protein